MATQFLPTMATQAPPLMEKGLDMVGFLDDFRAVKVMDVQEVKLRTAKADTKEASGELFEVL